MFSGVHLGISLITITRIGVVVCYGRHQIEEIIPFRAMYVS